MFDNYIMERAFTNIWCNPGLDNNLMMKLTKITGPLGVKGKVELCMKDYALPTNDVKYHVYQIGQLWPTKLNLNAIYKEYVDTGWVRLDTLLKEKNLYIDLYTDIGIHHPLHRAWYRFTEERDLVICLEDLPKVLINYREEDIYIRTYMNAWFDTEMYKDANLDNKSLYSAGLTISNDQNILTTQQAFDNINNSGEGVAIAFVNGVMVKNIDVVSTKIGDIVELIFDPTIVKVIDLSIRDLYTFNSKLDLGNHKYLLHYPDDGKNVIEYFDDNEVYVLYKYNEKGSIKGRYYHRNKEDSVRMVTHRDYSLMVDYVRRLAEDIRDEYNQSIEIDDMTIRLYIRGSSINKPLEFEHTRIHELYTLNDELIVASMTGLDSVVEEWKAENLEAGNYTKFMRIEKYQDMTKDLIEQVYGYNAMSYYTAGTSTEVVDHKVTIDHQYSNNCTVIEYDVNGRMLGAYYHRLGRNYTCSNIACTKVEIYAGKGGIETSVKYGKTDIVLNEDYNHKVYLSEDKLKTWKDITNDKTKYKVEDGKVKWLLKTKSHMLQVRQDDRFLMYNLELEYDKGLLCFNLQEKTKIDEDVTVLRDMSVPMGELDIYLNGNNLIEGIDYFVDFPFVNIVNKKYLNKPVETRKQNIHVRFCGFCNDDLSRDPIDDQGFIVHGVLSNNNIYDIRADKPLHIVVDGKVVDREDVKFSEFTNGSDKMNNYNGLPYMIRDIVVPLKDTTYKDTYYYRAISQAMDKKISEYMTLKFPQPERDEISAIHNRYQVVSPFVSRVLYAIIDKEIKIEDINTKDNSEVKMACKPYEYLLETDPISKEVDSRFIVIHPWAIDTTTTITANEMKFLRKVINIYCKQLVDITKFIKTKKD